MGLLEKAALLEASDGTPDRPLAPPAAPHGLMAKAFAYRNAPITGNFPGDAEEFRRIGRGLLNKANYFHHHPESLIHPDTEELHRRLKETSSVRRNVITSSGRLPSSGPKGLLARAARFREMMATQRESSVEWMGTKGLLAKAEAMRAGNQPAESTSPEILEDLSTDIQGATPSPPDEIYAETPGEQIVAETPGTVASIDHEVETLPGAQSSGLDFDLPAMILERESGDSGLQDDELADLLPVEQEAEEMQPSRLEGEEDHHGQGLLAKAEAMRAGGREDEKGSHEDGFETPLSTTEETTLPPFEASETASAEFPEAAEDEAQQLAEHTGEDAFESAEAGDQTIPESAGEPGFWEGDSVAEEPKSDFPDLEYSGNSAGRDDPALDGKSLSPGGEYKDPFEEWEREAEVDAEKVSRSLTETGPLREENRDRFLLDSEQEDFSTKPVEDRIASARKLDNYLSIFDLTREMAGIDEFEDFWESIIYGVMGQLGAEKICIFAGNPPGEPGGFLRPVAHIGFDPDREWALKPGDEIYDRCLTESGLKYAEEISHGGLTVEERDILEVSSAHLILPIRNERSLYGILTISRPMSGADYGLDDLEYSNMLSDLLSSECHRLVKGLDALKEKEELQRRNKMQQDVLSFSRSVSEVRSLDEIFDVLSQTIEKDFQVSGFSLVLLTPGEKHYRIFAGNTISPESIEKFRLSIDSELVGMISNITRVYELQGFRKMGDIIANYVGDDIVLMENYWILPLINMNWLVGFITIHQLQEPWTDYHREQMVALAQVMAPTVANLQLAHTRESVVNDPFSPLEERLTEEMARANEFHASLSLVDLKVKNIRRIFAMNPATEVTRFLTDLSRTISDLLYSSDYVSRMGQGRFAIILPGRNRREAELFVNRLMSEVERKKYLSSSPVEIQFARNLLTAPDDADNPVKLLSMLE